MHFLSGIRDDVIGLGRPRHFPELHGQIQAVACLERGAFGRYRSQVSGHR